MADFKELAAKEFERALLVMRERAVDLVMKFRNLPKDQLYKMITIEMESFVMDKLNFKGDVNKLMEAYTTSLKGTRMFIGITEETIQSLVFLERQNWILKSRIEVAALQKEFMKATISNNWNRKNIIQNLLDGKHTALTPKQIHTEITTALSNFNRNINTAMMEEMPDNRKYVYSGILDAKTRDYGLEMMSAGALTLDEIKSTYPDSLSEGCGWNCRGHKWTLVQPESQSQAKGAKKELKARAENDN